MKTKVFEVRDRATFIPVLATRMCSGFDSEIDLLRRVGFSGARAASPILITKLAGNSIANLYPHCWGDRTMNTAHAHIEEQFDVLETGAVIDVEYLLGETREPKKSEAKG